MLNLPFILDRRGWAVGATWWGLAVWGRLGWLGLGLGLLGVLLGLGGCSPKVEALFCRSQPGLEVCVLDLRRSAKNFWEYNATIEQRPEGADRRQSQWLLDCRYNRRRADGEPWRSLRPNGIGSQICQLYSKTGTPN